MMRARQQVQSMSSLAGQTFAGYEIISQLGRGGMGAVFKARQPKLDRLAALKIMAPELASDPDFVARFKREAAAAANLSHPNIVQVYTAGESDGTHYIAMEFVDGETLKQHIENRGRLDPREAIAITVFVAEALQYGWNKAKLVHRDIKPDNIFLSKSGEVKVGDLGLAKTVGGATTNLTQTGMMMGSPHYISPEQARGAGDIDFHTDIYSLGCTLYHMLTGRPPYDGPDPLSVITKHVNDPPPAIFKSWPGCPVPLALVLGKMLAKRPQERPASYEDLIEQLRAVHDKLKPLATAAPVSPSDPTQMLTPTPAPSPVQPTPKPVVAKVATARPATAAKAKPGIGHWPWVIGGVAAAVAMIAGTVWWIANPRIETKVLDLNNGVTMAVSVIPPGKFLLGSTKDERQWVASSSKSQGWPENEGKEPRKVEIKQPFWIGQTEVTVAQWRQFATARSYLTEAEKKTTPVVQDSQKTMGPTGAFDWRNPKSGFALTDNQAATWLSWNDAVAFCKWLDGREHDAGRLPAGWVVRLPTEAEWEYACRAGTRTRFWWGEAEKDGEGRLNKAGGDDGFDFIAPVDSFGERGRNRFGLADMLGNAREWCLDEFDDDGAHGEMWVGNPGQHVQKGGCAFRGLTADRCAFREKCRRNYRAACTGFRIAVGPEPCAEYEAFVAPRGGPGAQRRTVVAQTGDTVQQPRQIVHLLGITDAVKDRVKVEKGVSHSKANAWERRGGALVYTSDGGSGKIAPPVAINARSYEIEVEFERLSGPGRIHVDLPLDGNRIIPMNLDNPNIKMINTRLGNPWPANRGTRSRVVVRFERDGTGPQCRIMVRLDGEWVTDWRGNENNVAQTGEPHPDFPGQPVTSIYIHKDSYEVRTWQLRIFDGEAKLLRGSDTTSTAAADTDWQNAINLLPLVNPKDDATEGTWVLTSEGLKLETPPKGASLELPYAPPEEYDFEIEFTPAATRKIVNQFLSADGRSFVWKLGRGLEHDRGAFEVLDGAYFEKREDATEGVAAKRQPIESGQRYTSRVEVRRGSLRALVNGEEIVKWSGNFSRLSWDSLYRQRDGRLIGVGSWNCGVVFHRIEVREIIGKGTFTRGTPAATVNLLPLIDPQKDAVEGTWTRADGGLMSDISFGARLQIPYEPPDEYDFLVSFTRLNFKMQSRFTGWGDTSQSLSKDGKQFKWFMGAHGNTWFGFDIIGGQRFDKNPTGVKQDECLQLNRRYTSLIAVRKNSVKAFLNDKLISEWRPEQGALAEGKWNPMPNKKAIGIGSCNVQTLFHTVEVREVTGKGKLTRTPPQTK
jgi:serine/threonine-protein kinase